MANDVSVFGARVTLYASQTFPTGFLISQFADDADPFDTPSLQIADKAMGANGDLVVWSKANPIILNLSLIPDSDDDFNVGVVFESNRIGRGKFGARDVINVTVIYPSGDVVNFNNGKIMEGPPASSASSAGRLKSKTYMFAFESMNRS